MNITMDELSLKKVKFGAEPASTTVEAPAPEASDPQKGMNALTFMGMKNLMSNPRLAQQVGVPAEESEAQQTDAKSYVAPYSSNIAFQGKADFLKNPALKVLAAVLITSGAGSCTKENNIILPEPTPKEVVVNVSQVVNVDLSGFYNLIATYMDRSDARWNKMYELVGQLIASQNAGNANTQAMLELLVKYEDLIKQLILAANQGNANLNKLLEKINQIYASNLSADEKLAMLVALVTDIRDLSKQGVEYSQTVAFYSQALLLQAQLANQSLDELKSYAPKYLEYLKKMYVQNDMIIAKLEVLDIDMNANAEALAQQLGISISELKDILKGIGLNVDNLANYTAKEIIALLKAGNRIAELTYNKVNDIFNKLVSGGLDEQEIRALLNQMVALLSSIDTNVADIKAWLQQKFPELMDKINKIIENQDEGLIVLSLIKKGVDNGMTKEQAQMIINFMSEFKGDFDKLIRLACSINQNVIEGFNMTNAQLQAILNAIKSVENAIPNMDISAFADMMRELLVVARECKGLLADLNLTADLLAQNQYVIIEEIKKLGSNVVTPADLNQIEALLQALLNKPGYDDSNIVAKLNEVIEILLTHEFCHCNCSGSGDGNHEGIIGDILTCLNS